MTVGFIGLGRMGQPMVRRLVAAGRTVVVFDVDQDRSAALCEAGALAVGDLREVAEASDVVITMLPDSTAVANIVFGDGGLLSSLSPAKTIIDMGSSHPVETRKLGDHLSKHEINLVDAPVSGGVAKAAAGALTIMVGGDTSIINQHRSLLEVMGETIIETGSLGSAHALKALNNMLSAVGLLAAAEVVLIGQNFGLDAQTMIDAINASTGRNNSTEVKFPNFILTRTFDSGFLLEHMLKDMTTALDLSKLTETPAPSCSLVRELTSAAHVILGQGRDHTEVVQFCERLSGNRIGDKL